jgi:hypothetical protein
MKPSRDAVVKSPDRKQSAMSNFQQMSATGTRFEIKPSKTCHIQYSFNEFVPREFPRERELKEQL